MVGLLGGLMPGEDPMQPAALVPRGLLEMLGPSVMSRMQAREKQQEARMAAGDRSPTPLDEEGMMLADDLAGGLLGTISRVDDLPEMIARLLREGRAAEVTDDLLARLGPNENARLVELYEAGATGMPMPMDEASRMARAESMGFGPNLLHGTGADIHAFRDNRRGNYLTDRPEIADIYSTAAGSGENSIRAQSANAAANTMPIRLSGKGIEYSDLGPDGSHGWLSNNYAEKLGYDGGDVAAGARYRAMDARAKDEGYTHAKLTDMLDLGGEQTQWRILDREAVRSRFARFDPRLRNNANLLASIGGLGLLGVQLDQQPEGNW